MAGAGRDTAEALLKEVYIPGINRQLNEEILLAKRLESRSDSIVEGLYAVVEVDLGRTAGVGPARERGALPAAGKQRPERATYNLKSLYGRGEVTGQLIRSTRTNQAAFAKGLRFEAEGLQRDVKKDFARQAYGGYDVSSAGATGGVNGSAAIARVNGAPAGNVITLDDDHAIRAGQLYVNMLIDATDDFVSTEQTGMTISAVTLATPSVTVDASGATADNDWLVRAGTVDTSGNVGITGISAVISASTFGGLNPASAGLNDWAGNVNSTGGAFDSDNLYALFNQTRIASGKAPTALYTTFGLVRQYFNELQAQVQYVEPMKLEGGFQTLSFFNVPFIGDMECPLGVIYLPDEDAIHFAEDAPDWKPLDEDGHMLKWKVGFDMWEWALQRDIELIANKRNSSAKMTGLTDSGY
jgi:hypothetical protein